MRAKPDFKIAAAWKVAATLPPFEAQIIRDLCVAHTTLKLNNSQLWYSNDAMRKDLGLIAQCPEAAVCQRLARRHVTAGGENVETS